MKATRRNQYIAVPILIAVMFLLIVLPVVSAAASNDRICADETISTGTFGNVTVASGTSCTLTGDTVVEGNLKAKGAVDLFVSGGVSIKGNVSIEEATGVVVMNNGATIGGNVEAKDNDVAVMLIGSCQSGGITVNGDVTIVGNTSPDAFAANCSVFDGNLVMKDNIVTGPYNAPLLPVIQMHGSTIGGNAQMKGNSAPSVGFWPDIRPLGGAHAGSVVGNVEFKNNSGVQLYVIYAPVDGNVSVVNNDSDMGLFVGGNTIDGNLTCKNNDPDAQAGVINPDLGSGSFLPVPNTVEGKDKCVVVP